MVDAKTENLNYLVVKKLLNENWFVLLLISYLDGKVKGWLVWLILIKNKKVRIKENPLKVVVANGKVVFKNLY